MLLGEGLRAGMQQSSKDANIFAYVRILPQKRQSKDQIFHTTILLPYSKKEVAVPSILRSAGLRLFCSYDLQLTHIMCLGFGRLFYFWLHN